MAFYYARIFDAGVALENDVRRRRQAADELRFAVAAADRAGAAKTEFLAKMSHELRAPLNSVIGYSQLLAENAIKRGDKVMTKDVNRIHEAGQYLLDLINTILDLAKIDSGRIQFNPKEVGVRDAIDETVRRLKPVIERNGNRVSVQVDEGVGLVLIDRVRFIQVLDSIIINAAQHTRDGFIAIHAECVPGSAGSRAFSVSISDSGTGIDPERLSTLFETFTASQDASGGRYGGTGLSLSVTYKLCRAMGGDIVAESCPGKGSTFIVTLPLDGTAPRSAGTAVAAGRKDA
jgi:signal transduction histidine kinase